MKAHVHVGALEVFHFALMLVIVGFLFRMIEYKFPESKVAQALSVIY